MIRNKKKETVTFEVSPTSFFAIVVVFSEAVSQQKQRSVWIEQTHHHLAKFVVLYGLGDVVIETGTGRVFNLVCHRVCRQSHNRDLRVMVLELPGANISTGIVPVLNWHLDIALKISHMRYFEYGSR